MKTSKNNKKYPLPVGTRFTYRTQAYIVARNEDVFPYTACEEVNAQYTKDNPYLCVALTKTGTSKFCCNHRCGPLGYPKRVK